MKNKFNIFLLFFLIFVILTNIFATIRSYKLPYYNCDFIESNNHVLFKDILINSDLYRNGAQIHDTLIAINNIPVHKVYEVKNKYLENFSVGDTVSYLIKRNKKIIVKSVLTRRFSLSLIITSILFSFLFIILSVYLYIISNKTIIYKYLIIFYILFSSIIILTHVPLRAYFLYSLFLLFSSSIFIVLLLLSFYFYKNTYNKTIFFLFLIFDSIITISWISSYIIWAIKLTVKTHKIFILNLRLFHVFVLIIVSFVIITTLKKLLYRIKENQSTSLLISSSLFSVLLLIFPILYSIPISINFKELIPFDYYYYLYIFPLIYIILQIKSNKKD